MPSKKEWKKLMAEKEAQFLGIPDEQYQGELQFRGRENGWIRLLISLYQLVHRHPFLDRRFGCRRRENESQTQDQGSTALQEFTHGSDPGLRANRS